MIPLPLCGSVSSSSPCLFSHWLFLCVSVSLAAGGWLVSALEKIMRVVVSGGGSGGHIFPALAVAQSVQKLRPDAEVLYIGGASGMECQVVPRTGRSVSGGDGEETAQGVVAVYPERHGVAVEGVSGSAGAFAGVRGGERLSARGGMSRRGRYSRARSWDCRP